jgi:hypothetical protein
MPNRSLGGAVPSPQSRSPLAPERYRQPAPPDPQFYEEAPSPFIATRWAPPRGALLRRATQDRNAETVGAAKERRILDRGVTIVPDADDETTIAITPGEAVASFGRSS